jgi:hypothetical protein
VRGNRARQADQLISDVGRCIEEEPPFTIGTDGGRGLRTTESSSGVGAPDSADLTPTVPLGEASPSSGSEENDSQAGKPKGPLSRAPPGQCWLERSNVRGDFHGHGHNFSFGLGPRHLFCSARVKNRPLRTDGASHSQTPCHASPRMVPNSKPMLCNSLASATAAEKRAEELGWVGHMNQQWVGSPTLESKFLQAIPEGVPGNAEPLGRLGLISSCLTHCSLDHRPLPLAEVATSHSGRISSSCRL